MEGSNGMTLSEIRSLATAQRFLKAWHRSFVTVEEAAEIGAAFGVAMANAGARASEEEA
jgi:hypothetical protein